MVSRVVMLCDAYEHGYGQGLHYPPEEKPRLASAYAEADLREAYELGFDKGAEGYIGPSRTYATPPLSCEQWCNKWGTFIGSATLTKVAYEDATGKFKDC